VWIYKNSVQPEARGSPAVKANNLLAALVETRQTVTGVREADDKTLNQCSQARHGRKVRRHVAYPHFDRPVAGAWSRIPPEFLFCLDQSHREQSVNESSVPIRVVQSWRKAARRNRPHDLDPVRVHACGTAAPERTVGRERQENRQILSKAVANSNGSVEICDAYVHVHTKSNLPAKCFAMVFSKRSVTGQGGYLLFSPMRERMGPAPSQRHSVQGRRVGRGGQFETQVSHDFMNVAADTGDNFDAAFVEFRLDRVPGPGRNAR
jgi:hypothetical protein